MVVGDKNKTATNPSADTSSDDDDHIQHTRSVQRRRQSASASPFPLTSRNGYSNDLGNNMTTADKPSNSASSLAARHAIDRSTNVCATPSNSSKPQHHPSQKKRRREDEDADEDGLESKHITSQTTPHGSKKDRQKHEGGETTHRTGIAGGNFLVKAQPKETAAAHQENRTLDPPAHRYMSITDTPAQQRLHHRHASSTETPAQQNKHGRSSMAPPPASSASVNNACSSQKKRRRFMSDSDSDDSDGEEKRALNASTMSVRSAVVGKPRDGGMCFVLVFVRTYTQISTCMHA